MKHVHQSLSLLFISEYIRDSILVARSPYVLVETPQFRDASAFNGDVWFLLFFCHCEMKSDFGPVFAPSPLQSLFFFWVDVLILWGVFLGCSGLVAFKALALLCAVACVLDASLETGAGGQDIFSGNGHGFFSTGRRARKFQGLQSSFK